MNHSVIHFDDETHALVKMHCRSHGLRMRDWAGQVLTDAVRRGVVLGSIRKDAVRPRPIERYPEAAEIEERVWKQPPFWKGKAK